MRKLLFPFSLVWYCIISVRNYFYAKGWLKTFEFDFPVIITGNLSTGGTGKTPHVDYLIRLLKPQYKVAVLSRGYKRKTKGYLLGTNLSLTEDIGDEPKLLKQKHDAIEIAVSEDRVRGVYGILQDEPEVQVILLDDGFQHRRITAGMQIILTCYDNPFYNDMILPAGNLREPRKGYKRAQIIIVTKCPEDLSTEQAKAIIDAMNPAPGQHVFFSSFRYLPSKALFDDQPQHVIEGSHSIMQVSAIASNESLHEYISSKYGSVKPLHFPDHHYFTVENLDTIQKACDDNTIILITEKDAMKLMECEDEILKRNLSFFILPIEISFLMNGKDSFDEIILNYIKNYDVADV